MRVLHKRNKVPLGPERLGRVDEALALRGVERKGAHFALREGVDLLLDVLLLVVEHQARILGVGADRERVVSGSRGDHVEALGLEVLHGDVTHASSAARDVHEVALLERLDFVLQRQDDGGVVQSSTAGLGSGPSRGLQINKQTRA